MIVETMPEIGVRLALFGVFGLLACLALRPFSSAALRHAALAATLGGMVLIPIVCVVFPSIPLRVLPAQPTKATAVYTSAPDVEIVTTRAPVRSATPAESSATGRNVWLSVYLAGALALLGRAAMGRLRQRSYLRDAHSISSFDLWRPGYTGVRFLECPALPVPVAAGVRAPAIILPADWRTWNWSKVQAALAHEMAHIIRRDILILHMSTIARAVLWFHPCVWWMHRELSRLAEEACDDEALNMVSGRAAYAAALLEIAAVFSEPRPQIVWGAAAMARTSKVGRRIHRIVDPRYQPPAELGPVGRGAVGAVAAAVLALVALGTVEPKLAAQQPSGQAPVQAPRVGPPPFARLFTLDTAEVAMLEKGLINHPDDLNARQLLVRHYYRAESWDNWFRQVEWFAENQHQFMMVEAPPPAYRERWVSLWTAAGRNNWNTPAVLMNAGRLLQTAPKTAELFLRRAYELAPNNLQALGALAQLYTHHLLLDLRNAAGRTAEEAAFGSAAREALLISTDAQLVGSVGRNLGLHTRHPTDQGPADTLLAEQLLRRAVALAPSDPAWKQELEDLKNPLRSTRLPSAGPIQPQEVAPPVYPPVAARARVQGIVRIRLRIGPAGDVTSMTLVSGHPLLVPAALESVKRWRFGPSSAERETIAEVPFELAGAAHLQSMAISPRPAHVRDVLSALSDIRLDGTMTIAYRIGGDGRLFDTRVEYSGNSDTAAKIVENRLRELKIAEAGHDGTKQFQIFITQKDGRSSIQVPEPK